jgi:ribose transport system permease protein
MMVTKAVPEPGASVRGEQTSGRKLQIPETAGLLFVLLAMGIFFAIKSPVFLNSDNFVNILSAAAVTGIIAAPGTLLLISGHFDLSVGSGAALAGTLMATVVGGGHGLVLGVVVALLVGLGIGIANGIFISILGVSSLIATLAGLTALRGLTEVISNGQTLSIAGFSSLGTSRPFFNLPIPTLIVAVVMLIFWIILRFTVYGRSMYAIGSNGLAARLSGIRAGRAIFIGFVLSGLASALAGLVLVSQLSAAAPTAGTGLELSVVTAVVLGGTSLSGGRGSIVGTAIGLLIIGVLNNGLVLLNVNSFWQQVAQGVMLILAVTAGQVRSRFSR